MGTRIDKESTRSERAFRLLSYVASSPRGIAMSSFTEEEWGNPVTVKRLIKLLNHLWETFNQRTLLELVDDDGRVVKRGGRYVRFAAPIKDRERFSGRSATSLVAFHAMFEFLQVIDQTVISEAVRPIYDFLKSELSPYEAKRMTRLEAKFAFVGKGTKSYAAADDVLDEVYSALLNERKLAISFVCKGEPTTATLRPLGVLSYSNGLYLAGHFDSQANTDEPYTFKIETLTSAKMMAESFVYPPGINVKERYRGQFGLTRERGAPKQVVELEFVADEQIKRAVRERSYTNVDEFEELADGRLVLRFPVQGLAEVKTWVLSWGSSVKVKAPMALRDAVREEARKMAEC